MKTAVVLAAVAAAVALQLTLARFMIAQGRAIDLVLIVVIYVGLALGPLPGMFTGSVAGIAQDLLSGGLVGVGGLAKTTVGFFAGVAGQQFIVTHSVPRFFVFWLATLAHSGIVLGIYSLLDSRNLVAPYTQILTQSLGNGLIGVLMFKVIETVPTIAERHRARRRVSRRW